MTVAPEVNQFISTPRKLLIDGQWVEAASGKTFPVYNPATGQVMAHVAQGEKEDIDRAVRAARRTFDSGPWHTMTPSMRGRLLNKLADLV
ncbi:MAG: aldehyde dehydrogenase family protein, partial [Chloroflexi bacterium]